MVYRLLFFIALLLPTSLFCQEEPTPAATQAPVNSADRAIPEPVAPATPGVASNPGTAVIPGENGKPKDRIFGVLANYRTAAPSAEYTPLTSHQKYSIALHDSFDGPGYAIAAFYTAIYQLQNQNPDFGQGVKGYAHRYVTSYLDQMVGNMFTEGIMPSLLHEDPRYFRKVNGSVPKRTLYALSRIWVTRTDSGGTRFNFSEVGGNAITASIANSYYPGGRSVVDTMGRLRQQLISDSISNCLKEFWPDVKRKFFKKKNQD